MHHSRFAAATASLALVAIAGLFVGCDGSSSSSTTAGQNVSEGGARLVKLEYGRLVDIYSYQRIDASRSDRRDTANRALSLVRKDVVVDPSIETQDLFDAVGEERILADFRYLPFDVKVGHDELVILWDDSNSAEAQRYQSAFDRATLGGLVEVPSSFRDQNLTLRPMPVVPRNCAFKLTFDKPVGVDARFFEVNPGAIQLLRFKDDPNVVGPYAAFENAQRRVLVDGNTIVVDTTLIGGETRGGRTTVGMAPSENNSTANYRLALPIGGVVSDLFTVQSDLVPELNGVDSRNDASVIRDVRAGNTLDGKVGALADFESPTISATPTMGIIDFDAETHVLTINKRDRNMALRGRLPFVDGGIDPDSKLPAGNPGIPTVDQSGNTMALPSGDVITQTVITALGNAVVIRAEIVEVLDVGTILGDTNFAGLGLTAAGTDGGELATTRVRVGTISATGPEGEVVTFSADPTNPLGADCQVRIRYYEHVRYSSQHGTASVSDAARRGEFMYFSPNAPRLDPNTGTPLPLAGKRRFVDPMASVTVGFSEPMDTSVINSLDNFLLANQEVHIGNIDAVLNEPKSASVSFVAGRFVDRFGDGTQLMVTPPFGFFHDDGNAQGETYWFHMSLGDNGPRDLAGNRLNMFDMRPPGTGTVNVTGANNVQFNIPIEFFSVEFGLDPAAEDNLVSSRVYRFADIDEDGTQSGSIDYWGQFVIDGGTLRAADTVRRQFTADGQNLGAILRWDKGECIASEDDSVTPPSPAFSTPPSGAIRPTEGPGNLYWTPSMSTTQPTPPTVFQPPTGPQTFGGVVEPHTSRGSRTQMTYREDDFGLSYHQSSDLNLDVEQLHWAPWNDMGVLFDTFDRYTMTLSHSRKRPDLRYHFIGAGQTPPDCHLDCTSLFSGLNETFEQNYLEGAPRVEVVKDARYVINPNEAFRADSGFKFVPYPEFTKTFTWRDHRIVSWDMKNDVATGLGGAIDAASPPLATGGGDSTASVSSPWIDNDLYDNLSYPNWDPAKTGNPPFLGSLGKNGGWFGTQMTRDHADFLGDRTNDHDPIALPLLVDMMVFPDDTQSAATAANLFHIAYVGPIWTPISPGGYFNMGGGYSPALPWACGGVDWPFFRVHSSGGVDPNSGEYLVVPDKSLRAVGGWIKDMGLGDPVRGLAQTKPGDSHLHWAAMDTVRRVSLVTTGFFDTLQPNRHDLAAMQPTLPGLPAATGRPNFDQASYDLLVQDVEVLLDPPITAQSGGTSVKIELRGMTSMPAGRDAIYDRVGGTVNMGLADGGRLATMNLLYNPGYACEAYRYTGAHAATQIAPLAGDATPRVKVEGLTPYVETEELSRIRNGNTGLLPRYMNMRIVMENNVSSNPTVSPKINHVMLVFRMGSTN